MSIQKSQFSRDGQVEAVTLAGRLFLRVVNRRRGAVLAALAVLLLSAAGLPRLEWDVSLDSLYDESSEEVAAFREVEANFGSEAYLSAVLRCEDADSDEIRSLGRRLEERFSIVEGVAEVVGISRLEVIREGAVRRRELGSPGPQAGAAVSAVLEESSLVESYFVNGRGDAMAIHAVLEKGASLDEEMAALSEMRRILGEETAGSAGISSESYIVGTPVLIEELTGDMQRDLIVLGPVAMAAVGLVFFAFFRFFAAALIPLVLGAVSVVATFGVLGWLGIPVNFLASTIVLLISVIGSTEDFHFLSGYAEALSRGGDGEKALRSLHQPLAGALFLTSATTAVGFVTIALVPVPGLRDFGFSCAIGISLNFLFTLLLMPSMLRALPRHKVLASARFGGLPLVRSHILNLAFERPRTVLLATAAFAAVCLLGVSRVNVQTDYVKFLSDDSAAAEGYRNFDADFGGNRFYMVVAETGRENGVFEPRVTAALSDLHRFLGVSFRSVVSFLDLLPEGNAGATWDFGSDEGRTAAKQSLNRLLKSAGIPPLVDHDGSRAVFRVRSTAPGSDEMLEDLESVERFAAENLPGEIRVSVLGEEILISRYSEEITQHLLKNMIVVILIATSMVAFHFRSAFAGLLILIPNAIPLLAVFGTMGWLGIPLGTGTFSVAIVAVGIAVDDTIHFLTRFLSIAGRSTRKAIASTLRHEIKPITATSLAMISGFLVLALSSLNVHRESGILFAVAVASALAADLVLNPLLLRHFRSGADVG